MCVFMVMKEHVTQCNNVAVFWTTMELCGTEEKDISGFHTHNISMIRSLLVWAFLWDV